MASILLSEADPDVRRLLLVYLERLGHAAIVLDGDGETPPAADLLLLEPNAPRYLDQARIARERNPALPIVWMSMLPPNGRFITQGPNASLTKPFTAEVLQVAIDAAFATASDGRSTI